MSCSRPSRRAPFLPLVVSLLAAPLPVVLAPPVHAQEAVAAPAPPVDARVTTPRAFLGFTPGDDYKLANYQQSYAYFQKIAGETKRLRLFEVGRTAMGEPMLLAAISSEENLNRLDRLKEIARKLAEGRVADAEARQMAREGKAFVWIDGGMHATEVGCAQHTINLGYDLAAREDEEYRRIRENAVLLLIPSINPDGQNLVADWFNTHYGTPREGTPLPVLYQKYSGHDNNRDWYMLNLPETRNMTRLLYHEWFPQIVYNHHQTAPFPARIFVPPYAEPMNPNIPPLVMRGIHLVGAAMHNRFEVEGKSGVVSEKTFSTWWNGGMRTTPYFHNVIGILTETAHASPYPAEIRVTDAQKEPTTWYPNPYSGGKWRFADTVAYMNTGSMAVLRLAADHSEEFLLNRWRMARNAISEGERESPFGYIVPLNADAQRDPNTAALFLEKMRQSGLEVHRAEKPFTQSGKTYPVGTAVLLAAQANRPHLIDMVTAQKHPMREQYPGGPPIRPYDVAGWTLTFQMGVTTIPLTAKPTTETRAALRLATDEIRLPAAPAGKAPSGGAYLLPANRNASFTAVNRLLAKGIPVERWTMPRTLDGRTWGAGTFVLPATDAAYRELSAVAADLRLPVTTVKKLPAVPATERLRLRPARVATYDPYGGNMPQGWTQLVLETFAFPHTPITNPDIRAGNLRAKADALILTAYPNVRNRTIGGRATTGSSNSGSEGTSSGSGGLGPGFLGGPAPKELAPEVKARLDGIGEAGEANLRRFVEEGGTLLALDSAVAPVVELFKLPLRDVTTGSKFYSPGSVFRLDVDPTHPLCWGLPESVNVYFDNGPAWDSTLSFPSASDGGAFARYPNENPLLSGWIIEDETIRRRAAGVQYRIGKGRVVVYGFDVIFRGQPHMGFPLLFNALYPSVTP
jgi:hypothetical protein